MRVELITTARDMKMTWGEILVMINQFELLKFSLNFSPKTLFKWYLNVHRRTLEQRKESIVA